MDFFSIFATKKQKNVLEKNVRINKTNLWIFSQDVPSFLLFQDFHTIVIEFEWNASIRSNEITLKADKWRKKKEENILCFLN